MESMALTVTCQINSLENIFVSSEESTHQLNIHVKLIGYLQCNFILVSGPIFHLANYLFHELSVLVNLY